MGTTGFPTLFSIMTTLGLVLSACEESSLDQRIAVLSPIAFGVGDWQGTSQPRRASSQGAWREQVTVQWQFSDSRTSLRFQFHSGRLLEQLELFSDDHGMQPELRLREQENSLLLVAASSPDNSTAAADPEANTWMFQTPDDASRHRRVTIRRLRAIRLLILVEQRAAANAPWRRMTEYGLTRQGFSLAAGTARKQECIITGGRGTITVIYAGESYPVCCDGCRKIFRSDPAIAIARWRRKLESEK